MTPAFVAYVFYNTGVAHEVEQDDYWNGYFIPKGTRILPLDLSVIWKATKRTS